MGRFWPRFNLWIFPLLTILFLMAFCIRNFQAVLDPQGVLHEYLRSAARGNIGLGDEGYYNNRISFYGLQPGDIILGGYPNCAYGRYSHAGLYIGNGLVLEAYVDMGVCISKLDDFKRYSRVCLLHVDAPATIKARAVAYASRQEGGLFFPIAFKPGERIWNCTKIMWKAYEMQGVDLDQTHDIWVVPDAFYKSPHVKIIREMEV